MAYSPEQWERAKAFFESGKYSLSEISIKTNIDKSQISRKSKIQQWQNGRNSDYIDAKLTIATKNTTENTTTLEVLNNIADEHIRNKNLVYGVTQKALQKAHDLIDEIDNANDLKAIVDLSDRASLTLKVNERFAPKTDINLTNAQQNNEQKIIKVVYE